jgi:flagellar basal body-associated protein FliL
MPAPEKTKKPKKLDKGKKGDLAKKNKKNSSNLMLILSVVGVVVLLAVGITMFFLLNGGEKPITPTPGKNTNQLARETGGNDNQPGNAGGEGSTPPPDIAAMTAKVTEMIDKLGDSAKKDEASRSLKDMLESDLINKVPNGKSMLLTVIAMKAKTGNDGAAVFLKKLTSDSSNPTLAQAALKVYNEHLKKEGEKDLVLGMEPGDEPTNFIPNKADVVFSIQMAKFLESEFHRGVFTTGAFRQEDVNKRLGIPANTVEQFIVSGIKDFNQVAAIVRTTTPVVWEDVKKTMKLEDDRIPRAAHPRNRSSAGQGGLLACR